MAIIEITNQIAQQVTTTIGTVPKGRGRKLTVQTDNIPIAKSLYEELESLKIKGTISYELLEDPDIRDDIEAAPFFTDNAGSPPIGTPSDGDYSDGLLPLQPTDKLADALDDINVALLSGTGASEIGTPTVGDYTTGFFDNWIPTTLVADAFQDVGVSFLDLAPAKAGTLAGQALVLSGTTLYSAKIPSGLSASWSPLSPGDTISNLIVDNTYILTTPDQSTRFRAGKSSDPSTAGVLTHVLNGTNADARDIGVSGVGTTGTVTVDNLDVFNTFWLKATGFIDYTQTTEGRITHAAEHTEAGLTSTTELYLDDVNTVPSFSVAMVASLNTISNKWLSGILAWGLGTTIDISYTAASGIFEKAYHPTAVGSVSGTGYNTSNDNPSTTPAVSDTFAVSRTITLNNANQASLTPSLTATIRKPNGANASSVDTLPNPVNTYGTVSTTKTDSFFDEARRIVLDSGVSSGTATAFDSTVSLVNGNAQQRHSGILQYPNSSDYPGFTGDQEYQRFIAKASASAGAITFAGINYTDIDPYGTGELNVLLHITTDDKFFDLGRSIGDNNGTGSGNDRANSIGARNDGASSGSILAWSIGTFSTAFNGNEYRLIIIFRNNNHSLSSISEV